MAGLTPGELLSSWCGELKAASDKGYCTAMI